MPTLDREIFVWIVTHRVGALDGVMLVLSILGQGGRIWLALGVAFALFRRITPWAFVRLALALVLATLLADYVLKPAFGRARPFEAANDVRVIGQRPDAASFPSGHAANAFAGAFVLSRALPAAAIVWWTLAGAIAFSRVYLGVHYPLDLIAGAIVGLTCGALAWRLWPARR
jgi:undecaprenyl-diphosphatase